MTDRNGFAALRDRLTLGMESAAEEIFRRYAASLIRLADAQLASDLRPKYDGEEVVQSALRSFFARQQAEQFELTSWDSLWGLLARITLRKCGRREVYWRAARRNPHRDVSLDTLQSESGSSAWQPCDAHPTPYEVAVFRDVLETVFSDLSERQREMVILELQGHTAAEISRRVGRTVRTVRRTLRLVRHALASHCDAPHPNAGDRPQ